MEVIFLQFKISSSMYSRFRPHAFAAILANGSVVAWGNEECGGDNSAVQDQQQDVRNVQSTQTAFAAILEDESVTRDYMGAISMMVVIARKFEIGSGCGSDCSHRSRVSAILRDGSVCYVGLWPFWWSQLFSPRSA